MAEAINAQNIDSYLLYLSNKLQQSFPAPYNSGANFNSKTAGEIATALEALYERLGIPKQTGWSFEDGFLKEPPLAPPPVVVTPTISASSTPAYEYYPVAPGIGRLNFKPFLYWVEERLKRSLDLFGISAWDQYGDEAIRNSIPGIYRSANITPDEAKQLELGFLGVYHQKVAPVTVQTPLASMPAPHPVQPMQQRPAFQTTTVRQVSPLRRFLVPGIILLVVAGIGIWLGARYSAYNNLPSVYALTNNIALRKDAADTSPVLGRMDIFGTYLDGKNTRQTSASKLKLNTPDLTNGFYQATSSNNFWSYLTGNDSTLYVHTKYVTTDKSLYEKYSSDLENLKDDYNELDKLGFIYRQLIGRAVLKNGEGTILKIAASCKPSLKLSRIAPLSIGKYRNRTTGELNVLFQATDGFCYVLRGGENEQPPTITPVTIMYGTYTEPMKAGGMVTRIGNGNTLRFEYCKDGQVFFGQPPYTLFMPLPARVPEVPVPDDDPADAVTADTTNAGL